MSEIVWEDLPAARGGTGSKGKWAKLLEPLMERPGKWARVGTRPKSNSAYSTACHLRRGKLGIPEGRWEFKTRSVEGEYRIYARYLGPKED